jgi:steroid Delta-isomerase
MSHRPALDQLIRCFETLSQENIDALANLYSSDAYFKDPFSEVRGHAAILSIFRHMFRQVDMPRFEIRHSILDGDDAFIVWDFHFWMKYRSGSELCIHGSSHLRFTSDHMVDYHRDYWDAAEEFYEKVAVLGSLMRFLKRRVRN